MSPKETADQKEKKLMRWLAFFMANAFFGTCIWQFQKMNNNIEGLTNSVIEVVSEVKLLNGKMIYVDERLNKHDAKFDRIDDRMKDFFDTYDLKRKK